MKKLLFLVAFVFCFSVFSYSQADKATIPTLAKATGQTKLVPATLIKACLERVAETEVLFGFAPGTLVREVYFDATGTSRFISDNPNRISISVETLSRGKIVVGHAVDSLNYIGKAMHEASHACDFQLGLYKDSVFLAFFNGVEKAKLERLFRFVYGELNPAVCLFDQKVVEYEQRKNVVFSERPSLGVPFEVLQRELTAEVIATLDSYCWEDKVSTLFKQDKDVFRLYGRTLFLIKDSIQRNPKTANIPVVKSLEDCLKRMKEIPKQ